MRRRAARFMRACVFASAASLLASAAPASPVRVASLNLCTDELVLLLAAPGQIASVTHLARDRDESPFWRLARRHRSNDGSMVSVAGLAPDLIVGMGAPARDRERLAARIGAAYLPLPYPRSFDDLETAIARLAGALGRARHGRVLIERLRRLRATAPRNPINGLFVTGSGVTHAPGSLGARWLALAGVRPPADIGTRIPAERLASEPPRLVILSSYRAGQTSRGQTWPGFRLIDRAPDTRVIRTDGRLWTCAGPALIPEIERLRERIGR